MMIDYDEFAELSMMSFPIMLICFYDFTDHDVVFFI